MLEHQPRNAPRPSINAPEIPESELRLSFARSGGAGGQNVNKVETKVSVSFDLWQSRTLSAEQKRILFEAATERSILRSGGLLVVTCQEHRSQHMNRDAAIRRLRELVSDLLIPQRDRLETLAPPSADIARRLHKEERSRRKALRGERTRQILDRD